MIFRLEYIKHSDVQAFNLETLSPSFKGAVFNYLTQVLQSNQLNHQSFSLTVCREHFLLNPITLYFRKSSYLVDDMNDLIELLKANGLIDFWMSEYSNTKYLKRVSLSDSIEPFPLSFRSLKGIFMILCIGLFTSLVVFVVELSSNFLRNLLTLMTFGRPKF